ncbi:uncharacterized protein DUF1622 [Luteimonas cucumeris]|uniref:Uncharacterized protein DUF1622 n=1 Tax=Luteimonas cucumeris TaxID=985012 RepID=A0A562LF94_9GAMM|nr:DUF1622 domain-containing protein [Luteimonas cucumeris]TWI06291.1 uncharacterized protein DUF1622 [Luteimonas cucumeris]
MTGPLQLVELAALGIELLAVTLIVASISVATVHYVVELMRQRADPQGNYELYRRRVGRALLVGLEILVAADIIRTVALDGTLQSVALLGLLVVIRTFLSWSLVLEVEGRGPWVRKESIERPPGS